jgi:hypothetical protein
MSTMKEVGARRLETNFISLGVSVKEPLDYCGERMADAAIPAIASAARIVFSLVRMFFPNNMRTTRITRSSANGLASWLQSYSCLA